MRKKLKTRLQVHTYKEVFMKFVRFEYEGDIFLGLLSADGQKVIRLSDLLDREIPSDMNEFITSHEDRDIEKIRKATEDPAVLSRSLSKDKLRLLSPIERPLHDILCVGFNYSDHFAEIKKQMNKPGLKAPEKTVYFAKRALYIAGDGDEVQGRFDLDTQMDYEVELAVILGKGGKDIPKEKALDHVFGYCVFNDLSSRAIQTGHKQWFRGKSLDGYTAMGPYILHHSAAEFPMKRRICAYVNGELRQDSNTEYFVKDVPSVISELSEGMTLCSGDIIATGTPAGVGMAMEPPRFLKPGDIVTCEIEGLGKLTNTIK